MVAVPAWTAVRPGLDSWFGCPDSRVGIYDKNNFLAGHVCAESAVICTNEKSAQRRRKHSALAVEGGAKIFRPDAEPLPRGAGRPKFNQLERVNTFTYKPSLMKIDARNFELSW